MTVFYKAFGWLMVAIWVLSGTVWVRLPEDTTPELVLIAGLLALILGKMEEPQ